MIVRATVTSNEINAQNLEAAFVPSGFEVTEFSVLKAVQDVPRIEHAIETGTYLRVTDPEGVFHEKGTDLDVGIVVARPCEDIEPGICRTYSLRPMECGVLDEGAHSSKEMCCACGGGAIQPVTPHNVPSEGPWEESSTTPQPDEATPPFVLR